MSNFANLVEGEWKSYIFKFVTEEDHAEIFQHLRKYWYSAEGEIMAKYAGAHGDEDYIENFQSLCRRAFEEDTSFIARDTETNELAAIRLTYTLRKSDVLFPNPIKSKAFRTVGKLIKTLESKVDLFEFYDVDHMAYFLVESVAVKFRGQGLASEMYRRSLELLKAKKCPLVTSDFSSPYTRKAVANLGFKEICRLYLKDFKDENGELGFKGCGEDDCVAVMCLKLKITPGYMSAV